MKRKELYEYVRESIVNELTVTPVTSANVGDVKKKISSSSGLTNTQKTDLTKSATPGSTINLPESELEEMSRKANNLKVSNREKFEAAKDLYEGSWIANLLNFIAEAGEEGISQKDLAEKLGKKDSANINPAIQELKMVGAIATTRIKGDTSPEVTEPEEDGVIAIAGDEEEVEDEEDTFFKVDKEFDTPEEEPKMADIKAVEKDIEKTASKGIDDEKIKAANAAATIVKNLSTKIKAMKNKDAEYEKKMKALKQYIQNNRSILTKVSTIKNLTGDLIS
jgi:hypothetical protein